MLLISIEHCLFKGLRRERHFIFSIDLCVGGELNAYTTKEDLD